MKILNALKICFFFGVFFCVIQNALGQNSEFSLSSVIDNVAINNTRETFALYLPSTFDESKKSGIVFIFEPAGRGALAIKQFIDASEKYNLILICSNDSKNGDYDENFEITNRLFAEVFNKFKIDEAHIYVSGFSGGARLATTIAIFTEKIRGVLACGAGNTHNDLVIPSMQKKFLYKGLVGIEDMNYLEMLAYKETLESYGVTSDIRVFDGGHVWPPAQEISRGFDWFFLLNTSDNSESSKIFRDAQLLMYSNEKKQYLSENRLIDALGHLSKMKYLFSENAQKFQKDIESIEQSLEYSNQSELRNKLIVLENKKIKLFRDKFFRENILSNAAYDYTWWEKEVKKLNKLNDSTKELDALVKRVKYGIYAMAIENGQQNTIYEQSNKAIYGYTIASLIYPKNNYIYYLKALEFAKLKKKRKVYSNLQLAIDNGFTNYAAIEEHQLFIPFKKESKFKELIKQFQD